MKPHFLQPDLALAATGLKAGRGRRVNQGYTIDRGVQLGRGGSALVDGRVLLADLGECKGPDDDGKEYVDDNADVRMVLGD